MPTALTVPCARGVAARASGRCASDPRWVLTAAIFGSGIVFLDGTAVSIALPIVQREMRASAAEIAWVASSYSLMLASLLLVGGALADRYGRKRVFMVGLGLFAAASLLATFAPSVAWLVAARAAQGIGGALLTPASLALVGSAYNGEARGRAVGTWSAATSIFAAAGPLLAGWLMAHGSWRAVFALNVPFAIAVLVVVAINVGETRAIGAQRIDLGGAALASTGLGATVYGIVGFATPDTSALQSSMATLVGIALLGLFFFWESRARDPMLPLKLFRVRSLNGANLITIFLYTALDAAFFFLPFDLLGVQHFGPVAAGAALLPLILLVALLSRWAGSLSARLGPRPLLVAGPLLSALGFALLGVAGADSSYWTTFFPAILVLGFGMALSVAPLTTVVLDSVPEENGGIASGLNNAVSETGSLFAFSVVGVVGFAWYARTFERAIATLPLADAVRLGLRAQRTRLLDLDVPASLGAADVALVHTAAAGAFIDSFRLVVGLAAGLAILSAITAALMLKSRPAALPKT